MFTSAKISARRSANAIGSSSETFGSSYRSPKTKTGAERRNVPGAIVTWASGAGSPVEIGRQEGHTSDRIVKVRCTTETGRDGPLVVQHVPVLERTAKQL